MKQYKVIVADSSEEFCQALERRLSPFCRVQCCRTGWETLEMVGREQPDLLMLDLMLPRLDGISLLEALEATGCSPVVGATTGYVSPYILKMAENLGVSCLFEKPCSLEAVEQKIRQMLTQDDALQRGDLSGRISAQLLSLGFSPKLRGYAYLREAVACLSAHRGICIIKDLYPRVAGRFGITAEDVEHSIRRAVLTAWKRRKAGIWERYFGREPGSPLERPTNAALIQALQENLDGRDREEAAGYLRAE